MLKDRTKKSAQPSVPKIDRLIEIDAGILHLSFVANITHTKCPENRIGLMKFHTRVNFHPMQNQLIVKFL